MDSENLDRLAAELERHPLGRRQPPLDPYLDAVCETLHDEGLDRVLVEYIDIGPRRNRGGAPRYEPAGVLAPGALSRMVLAITDRVVPPPQPGRHIGPGSRDEMVTIDPSRMPRVRHFREGVSSDKVEVAARDDSRLFEINRALRACSATEVKAVFDHKHDGRATVNSIQVTPTAVILPADLVERIDVWVIRIVERRPLDLPMLWASGFVLFEADKDVATLHHRTCRMFDTGRSID